MGQTRLSRRLVRTITFAGIPTLFVALLALGLFARSDSSRLVGRPLPDFRLDQVVGDEDFSSRDLDGHPAVINFWASWCLPCRDEAPILESQWRKYRIEGLIVLGVNVQDVDEDAEAFVAEYDLSFPNVRDVNLELWRKLGVRGIPETFFLNRQSTFVAIGSQEQVGARGSIKVLGPVQPAILESQIKRLLGRTGTTATPSPTSSTRTDAP